MTYYLGEEIPAYEYKEEGSIEEIMQFYPIFKGEELAYFAIIAEDEDGGHVQISDVFVSELKQQKTNMGNIAFVYDTKGCYIISDGKVFCAKTYEIENPYRGRLDFTDEDILQQVKLLQAGKLVKKEIINIDAAAESKGLTAYLNVPFVSQEPPSNLCWAASVACIGNYLTGYSYTAPYIALYVYGSYYNQGATLSTALNALLSKYSINYIFSSATSAPSDSLIYNNLSAGYPVYSIWTWYSGSHATVIKAISTGTYVIVMDPEYGMSTAYKASGVYKYYSGYSGVQLKLCGYGAKTY